MSDFTVVFFGNGPVAARSLELLLSWQKVEMVVTKTKPTHHKEPAPVEIVAKNHNLPLLFASNKQQLNEVILKNKPLSKLGLVIDYGVIIDQQAIDYFKLGIVNSHFSLLPEWRGADPISYAILSGQEFSGVSLMTIDEGLDTGPLIASQKLKVSNQTNPTLTSELIKLSNDLLKKNLPKYYNGQIKLVQQDTTNKIVTYSKMLKKNNGLIDCRKPATVIEREVRAFKGWPASRLITSKLELTICSASVSSIKANEGELVVNAKQLYLGCGHDTSLQIHRLKPTGKQEMDATSFINGYARLI